VVRVPTPLHAGDVAESEEWMGYSTGNAVRASGTEANHGSEKTAEGLGSRLTYAKMAAVAVFLALGGGAYALSGSPDRGRTSRDRLGTARSPPWRMRSPIGISSHRARSSGVSGMSSALVRVEEPKRSEDRPGRSAVMRATYTSSPAATKTTPTTPARIPPPTSQRRRVMIATDPSTMPISSTADPTSKRKCRSSSAS
jgi:hypothetical protein